MNKILIADDEKWIRLGLKVKLNEFGYRFKEIYEAKNGVEALQIIRNEQPNIVITDIRMPKKSGIELIEEGLEISPNSIFIVISGYADFEYAEKAINMGAKGYLLKPLNDNNLKEIINKTIKELERRKEIKELQLNSERLDNYYRKESLINSFILEGKEGIDSEEKLLSQYSYFTLIIVNIDVSSYIKSRFKYEDLKLLKFSIKNIFNEVASSRKEHYFICNNPINQNQLIVLNGDYTINEARNFINEKLENITDSIKEYLNISITLGVSNVHQAIVKKLYEESLDAYKFNFINGRDKIYQYENVKYIMENTIQLPKDKIKLLKMYMAKGDTKNIKIILENLLNYDSVKNQSPKYISFVWFKVISLVIDSLEIIDLKHKKSISMSLLKAEILDRFESVDEIVNYLYTTILDTLNIQEDKDNDCKDIVYKIKKYIDNNYEQNLTTKELAYEYAINPKYLSTLFKREMGVSANHYITTKRLKRACDLLINTNQNITDISVTIGYNDPLYFFRVFKKYYNITPLEYRNTYQL